MNLNQSCHSEHSEEPHRLAAVAIDSHIKDNDRYNCNRFSHRRKKAFWFNLVYYLDMITYLPFKFFRLFVPQRQNYIKVADENWKDWTTLKGTMIQRKLVAETGFDGLIKFYHLKSTNQNLNNLLSGKIFGIFFKQTDYGVFLREFGNPDAWPNSYLVMLDEEFKSINRLRKVNSSWINWKIESEKGDNFIIITHPAKDYTKGISIKKRHPTLG